MSGFMDGTGVTPGTGGCKCGRACEFPCWQRIGMTATPCCDACAPLPPVEDDEPRTLTLTITFDGDPTLPVHTADGSTVASLLTEQLTDEFANGAEHGGAWSWSMRDGSTLCIESVEVGT